MNDAFQHPRGGVCSGVSLAVALLGLGAFTLTAHPLTAQVSQEDLTSDAESAATADLQGLERLAEDSFVEDDLDTAIALYRQLLDRLEARSEKVRILMTIAWLEHLQQQDGNALDTLTEAFVLEPDYAFRPELYSESFRQLFYRGRQQAVEARDRRAADQVSQGFEQLRQGDYAAARVSLNRALELVPNHPKGLYNLALVDLYDQRSEDAVAGFQKLLALADSGAEVSRSMRARSLTNLGFLYNQQGSYEEAERALDASVDLDANAAAAWSNLGVARRRLGKKQEAAQAFRQAYQLDSENAGAINNLALAYIDAEDWVSAVALLRQATERFPEQASLWLNLGLSQLGLGNQEGAVTSLERAIQQDPDDGQGWASAANIHLARHYYEAGNVEASLQAADRALSWRSDLVTGWIYRGLALRSRGDTTGALESLQKARNLDPSKAETHNNLGSVYADLGRLDEAKKAFEQALAIDPSLSDARQNLDRIATGQSVPRPAGGPPPPKATPRQTDPRQTTPRQPAAPKAAKSPPLGLRFADIDYSSLGLKGAMVENVTRGGVAERGGLRSGDLILKVDGRDVLSADQLTAYAADKPKGSQLTIDFLRSNVPQRLVLRLE